MVSVKSRFKREKRYLLFMPNIMGGGETQFRYLVDYAEKNHWKLDVMIEHRLENDNDMLKKALLYVKNVRIYELDWCKADYMKMRCDVMVHILRKIPHIRYSACLLYYTPDLALAPVLRSMGIHVIYSERTPGSAISQNRLFQKYLWYCDRILANSVHAQKELARLTGRKIGLIRNGKPVVEQFPLKVDRGINRILIPANITPYKNLTLPLQYLKEYPDFQGKIIFAGHTLDRAYQSKLLHIVKRYHLENKIDFLGYVENMEEEYRKADLVILPSFWEGTPNVVLEAYAYGRPVIASDIEGDRDVVRNPRLRFGVRSVTELHECIQYVQELSDEAYAQLLSENRQFVLRNYNIERMAEAFYKELSEGKRYSLWELGIMRFLHFYKSHAVLKGEK